MSTIHILGFSGSIRRGSFNQALLQNAQELLPSNVSLEIYEGLDELPLYTEDFDGANLHEKAIKLREAISKADGILIASPEHNFSLSAVLKNTLDWASRPYGNHPFINKPTAIVGASGGLLGTIRAQLHTREILHSLQADVVSRPEVLVTQAGTRFDSDGRLIDEGTKELLTQLLTTLIIKIQDHQEALGQVARAS